MRSFENPIHRQRVQKFLKLQFFLLKVFAKLNALVLHNFVLT